MAVLYNVDRQRAEFAYSTDADNNCIVNSCDL